MPTSPHLPGLFVTGTDTGVGKTYVTCEIVNELRNSGFRIGAYKPACSGSMLRADGHEIWEDIEALHHAAGGEYSKQLICPQAFRAPQAPPVAAQIEGTQVDESMLLQGLYHWQGIVDFVVVEGVGGWKCPVSHSMTVADLATQMGFPVLVVASSRLGVINHALLTIESVRSAGLDVVGLVLNDRSVGEEGNIGINLSEIMRFASISWVGSLKYRNKTVWIQPAESNWIDLLNELIL